MMKSTSHHKEAREDSSTPVNSGQIGCCHGNTELLLHWRSRNEGTSSTSASYYEA
jgi:hypothetical protein